MEKEATTLLDNVNKIISQTGKTIKDGAVSDQAVTVLELIHRIASTTWTSPTVEVTPNIVYLIWSGERKTATLIISADKIKSTRVWGNETKNFMREDELSGMKDFRHFWKWVLAKYHDSEELTDY